MKPSDLAAELTFQIERIRYWLEPDEKVVVFLGKDAAQLLVEWLRHLYPGEEFYWRPVRDVLKDGITYLNTPVHVSATLKANQIVVGVDCKPV